MKQIKLLLCLCILSLASACTTSVRQSPEFANTWGKKYSVAVLPIEANVNMMNLDGSSEKQLPKQNTIKRELPGKIANLLKKKNYAVRYANFDRAIARNPELRFELEKLRKTYAAISKETYRSIQMPEKQAFTTQKSVGPVINQFADISDTDLLLLTNFSGIEKSEGMIAKDLAADVLLAVATGAIRVSPTSMYGIEMALLSGDTGELMWSNVSKGEAGLLGTARDAATASATGALAALPDKTKANPKS